MSKTNIASKLRILRLSKYFIFDNLSNLIFSEQIFYFYSQNIPVKKKCVFKNETHQSFIFSDQLVENKFIRGTQLCKICLIKHF